MLTTLLIQRNETTSDIQDEEGLMRLSLDDQVAIKELVNNFFERLHSKDPHGTWDLLSEDTKGIIKTPRRLMGIITEMDMRLLCRMREIQFGDFILTGIGPGLTFNIEFINEVERLENATAIVAREDDGWKLCRIFILTGPNPYDKIDA